MHPSFHAFLNSLLLTAAGVTSIAAFLSIVGQLGSAGRALVDRVLTRAPALDVIVASLTWLPWLLAGVFGGWAGFAGALIGQMIGMGLWCFGHELAYREAARGPRIVKFINRSVGRWRNHLALWVTLLAVPGFWFIRFLEVFVYWSLVALLDFPRYRQSEWV